MKRYCRLPELLISLFVLLFSAACGTLEVGIERTATPQPAAVATDNAPTPTPPPQATITPIGVQATAGATPAATTDTAEPTPTPTPLAPRVGLRVAFIEDGNVWLWAGGESVALTSAGGVNDARISDDGAIVAFVRDDELWAVNADGSGERRLVSASDFAAMEPREFFEDLEVALYSFDWVPGAHVLAFNTRLRMEIGLALNDDLRLVDADTLEQTLLLPPGEGGEFYYSPDGLQVAVVTSGRISLLNADGSNRRDAFTYTPVVTYSEFQYYARPVWAADSASLRVAIPPADPLAQPAHPTTIWHISTDRPSARLIGDITGGPQGQFSFSPDLSQVVYLALPEGALPGGQESLLITDLESGETVTYYAGANGMYGWAPDAGRFAFSTYPGLAQAQIGQPGGAAVLAHDDAGTVAIDVSWVDATHYIYLAQSAQGWDIRLGEIDAPSAFLATVAGRPPAFDFAGRVSSAETDAPATTSP